MRSKITKEFFFYNPGDKAYDAKKALEAARKQRLWQRFPDLSRHYVKIMNRPLVAAFIEAASPLIDYKDTDSVKDSQQDRILLLRCLMEDRLEPGWNIYGENEVEDTLNAYVEEMRLNKDLAAMALAQFKRGVDLMSGVLESPLKSVPGSDYRPSPRELEAVKRERSKEKTREKLRVIDCQTSGPGLS